MTLLGRCMTFAGLVGTAVGLMRLQTGLTVASLSLLIWLIVEWAIFTWRVVIEFPQLTIERRLNGRSQRNGILWSGRIVKVDVLIQSKRGTAGPQLLIRDVIPENMEVIEHSHDVLAKSRFRRASFSYSARIRGAGHLRLPGFRVVLQDSLGFFQTVRFVRVLQTYRVLPAYADVGETQPLIKRINTLPQHGIHRLQRSGMGSELLELRDYVPGDPPKSIAWKVSARRDRLMTRQYESEVPVRVQLFLDGSLGTRVGGFGYRLLDQLTWVAATVARTATSTGDPVGAMLFDERGQQRIAPQSGERGFYRLLEAMSDFCVNPAPVPDRLTPELITFALSVASEQFPELLDVRVNQIPFTIFPLLPWKVRQYRNRVLLASIIAELYQMSATKHVQLIHDDALMATFGQHFLSQTGLSWINPVVSIRNRGDQDGMIRMELVGRAISSAVARAKDNEVFVVLADILECAPSISHLLPAVKMALARHHRVAFVCPTPSFRRPTRNSPPIESTDPESLLLAAEQSRAKELSSRLTRDLRRIGASVAFSGEQNAVRLILGEMDLARTGRVAAGGRRR
jgi:uncharacterized protein (DUF58 family)